jgi:hypothetical protein
MISCYRDTDGYPRVHVGDGRPVIGSFLEQDVQGSVASCREYLAAAEDVGRGRKPEWSGTGNAHTVLIRPTGVTIENVWDERLGVAELSVEEFKQCLNAWIECISSQPADRRKS